jgi:hypothetical protein
MDQQGPSAHPHLPPRAGPRDACRPAQGRGGAAPAALMAFGRMFRYCSVSCHMSASSSAPATPCDLGTCRRRTPSRSSARPVAGARSWPRTGFMVRSIRAPDPDLPADAVPEVWKLGRHGLERRAGGAADAEDIKLRVGRRLILSAVSLQIDRDQRRASRRGPAPAARQQAAAAEAPASRGPAVAEATASWSVTCSAAMRARQRQAIGRRYVNSPHRTMQVDFDRYLHERKLVRAGRRRAEPMTP